MWWVIFYHILILQFNHAKASKLKQLETIKYSPYTENMIFCSRNPTEVFYSRNAIKKGGGGACDEH